jgi:ABC-type glycerol-3-phosphate transport system permease component
MVKQKVKTNHTVAIALAILLIIAAIYLVPRLWLVSDTLKPEITIQSITNLSISEQGVDASLILRVTNPNTFVPVTIDRFDMDIFMDDTFLGTMTSNGTTVNGGNSKLIHAAATIAPDNAVTLGILAAGHALAGTTPEWTVNGTAYVAVAAQEFTIPFSDELN